MDCVYGSLLFWWRRAWGGHGPGGVALVEVLARVCSRWSGRGFVFRRSGRPRWFLWTVWPLRLASFGRAAGPCSAWARFLSY